MKIAMVADLHGNVPALEAVLCDIKKRRADEIWCLGDMIGKGPDSPATLDWALDNCAVILRGNWDDAVLGEYGFEWVRNQLGPERIKRISELPFEFRGRFCGKSLRLVHGRPLVKTAVSPYSPKADHEEFFLPKDGYKPDIVGFADVHQPFYLRTIYGLLFNVGSVGNSLARNPQAVYAVVECEKGDTPALFSVQITDVPYDTEKAARLAAGAKGLPKAEAFISEVKTGVYGR